MNSKRYKDLTDQDLILLHKGGDEEALGILFKKYMHLTYGACIKHLKNEDKAKDAVMELFEHLSKVILKHNIDHYKSWLYRVTFNHCMQILRREKRMLSKEKKYQEDNNSIVDLSIYNHPSIDKEELLVHLEDCIQSLKESQKQCIQLFYLKEQCYNQIVEQTGYALNKVKSYIQNGKRNLSICMSNKNE